MGSAERAGFGPFLSAIGAALLGVSVFFPWYALTLTAGGAASAQQEINAVAQQFGNATFQAEANTASNGFSAYAGRQLATVSGHDLLKDITTVLLILAAIALVGSLTRLAGISLPIQVGGSQIALVGSAAVLCVAFRMVELPGGGQQFVSLSLSWGIWLALASSAAILVGGLWPTASPGAAGSVAQASTTAQPAQPLPDLDEYWRS
jgi:hypothetical protein